MALTRRKFVARSAQLAGGALAIGIAGPLPPALGEDPSAHLAASPPNLPVPPLADPDYWNFADWLAPYFDQLWVADDGYYRSGNSGNGRISVSYTHLTLPTKRIV